MILSAIFMPTYLYPFAQFLSKGIFWTFNIKRIIKGKFPKDGPYILMHNHSSFLDLFLLPTIIEGKYTGIVAQKNFRIPIVGSLLKKLNAIPIQRSNLNAAKHSIQLAEDLIQKGFHIAIFPEGTRTLTGKINKFKKGGFHMAVNTKTKILPIVVEGLFSIKPKNRWTIMPQPVKLIIKDPVDVLNKSVDDVLEEVEFIYLNHELK
tara:strand:+ start:254 stop:871 length:618 start_codon:yes stop_codon:yes gene_type:complete